MNFHFFDTSFLSHQIYIKFSMQKKITLTP